MRIVLLFRTLSLASICLLSACADREPYLRTDVWSPTGAVQSNLAAMVANPRDLIQGRGDTTQDTRNSANAILRAWADTPRSLSPSQTPPTVSTTGIAGSPSSQPSSTSGEGGGGIASGAAALFPSSGGSGS